MQCQGNGFIQSLQRSTRTRERSPTVETTAASPCWMLGGKIPAKIIATRISHHIGEKLLPECQSGFRPDGSTNDMNFAWRQRLEKGREQHQPMSIALVDSKKAFDTVNKDLLFAILDRFGCPPIVLRLLRALHTGNTASVRVADGTSDPYEVTMGVKQGCVLAPLLFNVFLLDVTLLCSRRAEDDRNEPVVHLRYRCDGGAFRLQRLKARRRTGFSQYATCSMLMMQP